MRELCLACAGFALEFIVFYAAGIVLVRILKVKGDCSLTFILGYLVYFAVFELVIVPMTLKWVSLTAAAYIWAGIMALVICAAVICTIKKQRRIRAGQTETCSGIFGSISEIWKNHSVMIILAGAVVLLQCLIVIFYEDTTVDAAYYVGTVSTSVYTDTLGRYNPFNGAIQKAFQARYVFSAYPMHNAVWCRLLGIHPIVQAKQVMSCMNVNCISPKYDLFLRNFFLYQKLRGKSYPCQHCHPFSSHVCRLVSAGEKQQECLDHIVCHSGQCADIFRFCYHLSYRDRSGNGSGGSYE